MKQLHCKILQIIKVDAERNVLLVKGSIPGPKNSYVSVKSAVKKVRKEEYRCQK